MDAVVLAAGSSLRMGCSKLLLPLDGKPVISRFLERFPYSLFNRVVVVCSQNDIKNIAAGFSVRCLMNPSPQKGKSHSIQLGLRECRAAHGVMFFVADQPLFNPSTVSRLVAVFAGNRQCIVVPTCQGKRRNPVIFPSVLLSQLEILDADSGGREVIEQHQHRIFPVDFDDPDQFLDLDTPEAYQKVVSLWKKRHL